jgi:type I restriction enzyme, S subunit
MSAAVTNQRCLEDFATRGALKIQNGFPCGNWNDKGVGVLQLRPFNVTDGGQVDLSSVKFIETDKRLDNYLLRDGDVIFNNTNSEELVGKTAYWARSDRAVLSNHMTILRVLDDEALSAQFLAFYLLLKWYDGHFHSICQRHVNQASVGKDRLGATVMPAIELPEQKKIAHTLSTVQRAIEAQERIIQTTTELKKALMHKLFTEGLRHEPQKQTEIGPVPGSWEVRKLGDIATTISKGSSPKWQGFQYIESGILFVRSQNVGNGKMLLDDRAYLPASFNEKEKRSILQPGDILINLVGASIGRVALGTDEIEGGNCNQAVGFVRLKGSKSLKQLIVYFLLSPWGQEQMRRQKKDIARANLSLLDVRGFEIPIPSTEEEIEEVARALVTLEEKIATHERKRDQLQDVFRTLLHELMTAKTRVTSVDIHS